ncbi:MAG: four helix bundle protein [Candidatus Margulisbacteria bacterium]|nr:four helix bundle protein [Candidatus Margulisiibacteriota bacterium]
MQRGFKDLIVWQKGYKLSLLVYQVTKEFPKPETYGLRAQIRSCAISVPANISEGYERDSKKQYLYFLNIAKGSLGELETHLLLSKDLKYITEKQWEKIECLRREVIRLLRELITFLRKKI